MIKRLQTIFGVTLLEILLVLAIAAMVLVMSVRYYQSASQSQQVNTLLQMLQGITAAAESLSVGSGSYNAITSASLITILPGGSAAFNLPWGGTISYAASITGFNLTFSRAPGAGVCTLLTKKVEGMVNYTLRAGCAGVTYSTAGS